MKTKFYMEVFVNHKSVWCCMRVVESWIVKGLGVMKVKCFFNIVLYNEYHELFLHVIKKLVIDKISNYCAHV